MKWKNNADGEPYIFADERDKAILKAMIEKRDHKELAWELYMSHRTIEVRIQKMKHFLNARSTAELILISFILGIIDYEKPVYIKRILARNSN